MVWLWFIPLSFAGVATRHLLAQYVGWGMPISLGILLANVFGSLAIGWISVQAGSFLATHIVAALAVGFLGALTTFSGFALETVRLLQQQQFLWAGANLLIHNGLCIAFCYLGTVLGRS